MAEQTSERDNNLLKRFHLGPKLHDAVVEAQKNTGNKFGPCSLEEEAQKRRQLEAKEQKR